jgi:hypothetical protein
VSGIPTYTVYELIRNTKNVSSLAFSRTGSTRWRLTTPTKGENLSIATCPWQTSSVIMGACQGTKLLLADAGPRSHV